MQSNKTLARHADLVDRMAGRLGVDLEQAMMEGRLSVDQLGDAVLSCTGCSQPDTCERWLALFADAPAAAAPGYCRNGEMLGALAQGKSV